MKNIDELTVGEVKQLAALLGGAIAPVGSKRLPMPVGEKVFIITVTRFYTGKITAVAEEEVELVDAAWIADTGRFKDAMMAVDKLSEVEPYPDGRKVVVNRGLIADWSIWPYDLPRSQK